MSDADTSDDEGSQTGGVAGYIECAVGLDGVVPFTMQWKCWTIDGMRGHWQLRDPFLVLYTETAETHEFLSKKKLGQLGVAIRVGRLSYFRARVSQPKASEVQTRTTYKIAQGGS